MDVDDPTEDENAFVQLTALLVLGVGLVSLFLGYGWFWMVFAVGFAVVVPLVKLVTEQLGVADDSTPDARRDPQRDRLDSDAPRAKRDALDELRSRYASGELSDEEFERKVERLLETETLEGARDHVAGGTDARENDDAPATGDRDATRDRDPATER